MTAEPFGLLPSLAIGAAGVILVSVATGDAPIWLALMLPFLVLVAMLCGDGG